MKHEEAPLGYLFRLVHVKFKKQQNDDLACLNLTYSQMGVINYLGDHYGERITQNDIVHHMNLKHTTIIGILKRLEAKGMIRITVDPDNKRYRNICLTEKALRDFDKVVEHRQSLDTMLTTSLTPEEVTQLRSLLYKVLDSFPE